MHCSRIHTALPLFAGLIDARDAAFSSSTGSERRDTHV